MLALVAVGAFSALTASSAFAVLTTALANWLNNGAIVTANTSVTTTGELLFENVLNAAQILCSGIFVGTVGANGVDEVTEVLNLAEEKVGEAREELGIVCTTEKLCEPNPEIRPDGLPFLSLLLLDTENGLFVDELVLNANNVLPGYLILCEVLKVNVEELCESVEGTFGEVSNATADVEGLNALSPLATCNGNTLDGKIENNAEHIALIALLTGTLSVSE